MSNNARFMSACQNGRLSDDLFEYSLHGPEMELRVCVTVVCDDISDSTWRDTYERACLVAKQWTPGPLPIGSNQIGGVRVQQHVLDIGADGALRIDGQVETRTIGELLALALRA